MSGPDLSPTRTINGDAITGSAFDGQLVRMPPKEALEAAFNRYVSVTSNTVVYR
jgi:hypothetical protein